MDFKLSKEQQDIKSAAREFGLSEVAEHALEWDKAEGIPDSLIKKAAQLGFVGITLPESLGGSGFGIFEDCLVIEEFASCSAGAARAILEAGWGAEFLDSHQGNASLQGVVQGRFRLGLLAPPEPFRCKGRDEKLNGQVSLAGGSADVFMTAALVGEEEGFLVIPSTTAGMSVNRLQDKLGLRAWSGADIVFKDVQIGELTFVKKSQFFSRVTQASALRLSSMAIGVARGAMEIALGYSRNRRLFGKRLSDFEATRHKFFRAWQGIEMARLLTLGAASEWDRGKDVMLPASAAVDYTVTLAQQTSDEALQLMGGYGYFEEMRLALTYRDAKMLDLLAHPSWQVLERVWPSLANANSWGV